MDLGAHFDVSSLATDVVEVELISCTVTPALSPENVGLGSPEETEGSPRDEVVDEDDEDVVCGVEGEGVTVDGTNELPALDVWDEIN